MKKKYFVNKKKYFVNEKKYFVNEKKYFTPIKIILYCDNFFNIFHTIIIYLNKKFNR